MYQPKTGQPCTCRRGLERDNCPRCEGTGWVIDFRAIRERAMRERVSGERRESQPSNPLSCGHKPSPHGEHTTGTAHTPDGREICWACADAEQREELKTARDFTGYLSEKTLTTWTGGILANITRLWKVRNNMAGNLLRFRAIDVHGQEWYGTSPGIGMYARMHKAK